MLRIKLFRAFRQELMNQRQKSTTLLKTNLNFDFFLLQVDLEHGNSCYLPNWPLCAFWTAFLRTSTHSQPLRPNIDVVSLSVNTPRMQVILVGRWHKKLGIFPFMSRLLETHQVEFQRPINLRMRLFAVICQINHCKIDHETWTL